MKRIFSILSAMTISVMAMAAAPQFPQMNPDEISKSRVEQMDQRLNLTDEQETKILAIYKESFSTMPAFDMSEETRTKMMEHFMATEKKIEAVLNDAQKAEYAKMREEQRAQFGQ